MIELLTNCLVDKFISKKTFYEKANVGTLVKEEFVDLVEKITWKYKLSEDTININKTSDIEEIQVFEIKVKNKKIPKNVIKIITKSVKYKILFIIKYNQDFFYIINDENLYSSSWNETINFNFNAVNLENLYQNLIKNLIKEEQNNNDFQTIIQNKKRQEELQKQINALNNKLKIEKQFNKKVIINNTIKN